ncbi:hypothetical protein F2Q70_00012715 [Brassica cretica]|uniref:Uncharacterized protein n=1 Tax=Brassica cretica TaxID=69181 RepID=A0A8S9LZT6_BRACR|nr:hypothetical protein F2Q70_00012715 [Brassica cretica]
MNVFTKNESSERFILTKSPAEETRDIGVKNGYDEVNIQNIRRENEELFRRILFRNKFFLTKSFAEKTRDIRQELEKGRYAATERMFRSIATQRPNACSARSLRSDRASAEARSLHSDRAFVPLGRYIDRALARARLLHSDRARAEAWSLRSDRAFVPLSRYVATELEPKLGRYVATELF